MSSSEKYFEKFLKFFDMYGQSANFSYMGKTNFSTTCGGFISILIGIIFIYYLFVLIMEIIIKTEVFPLTIVEYNDKTPEYLFKLDKWAINNTKQPPYINTIPNEAMMQISVGIIDQRVKKFRPIDPRYFNIFIYVIKQRGMLNQTMLPIYFDLCNRFGNFDKEFTEWNLNQTYCMYTDFRLENEVIDDNFSYLNIDVNRCSNDSLYYTKKEELKAYKDTYGNQKFSDLNIGGTHFVTSNSKSNRNLSPDKEPNSPNRNLINNHKSKSNRQKRNLLDFETESTMEWTNDDFYLLNPRTELLSLLPGNSILVDNPNGHLNSELFNNNNTNSPNEYNKIICAPDDLINEVLNNMQVFIFIG